MDPHSNQVEYFVDYSLPSPKKLLQVETEIFLSERILLGNSKTEQEIYVGKKKKQTISCDSSSTKE